MLEDYIINIKDQIVELCSEFVKLIEDYIVKDASLKKENIYGFKHKLVLIHQVKGDF